MRVGRVIQKWRVVTETNIRDAAAQIGISASTVSRIENDKNVDGHSMILLAVWLFGPTEESKTP